MSVTPLSPGRMVWATSTELNVARAPPSECPVKMIWSDRSDSSEATKLRKNLATCVCVCFPLTQKNRGSLLPGPPIHARLHALHVQGQHEGQHGSQSCEDGNETKMGCRAHMFLGES